MFGGSFTRTIGILVLLLLTLAVGVGYLGSLDAWQEARREAELFEKLTGQHVTAEDAMYLDLRVVATPQDNTKSYAVPLFFPEECDDES